MTMLYSSSENDHRLQDYSVEILCQITIILVKFDWKTNSTKLENFFATDWLKDTTTMSHDWYQKGYISQMQEPNTEN